MEVYLIRHTTPKVEKGTCYGQSDLALEDSFEEELQQIRAMLPNEGKMPLYSSPLQRCHLLAKALNPGNIKLEDRLKEMNFGDWEMKPWQDIPQAALDYWRNNFKEEAPPNGESNAALRARIKSFWTELVRQPQESEAIGVVSHYGVMVNIVGELLEIPVERAFRLDLSYGAVIRVSIKQNSYYKVKFLSG